jgi:hypothetical protein
VCIGTVSIVCSSTNVVSLWAAVGQTYGNCSAEMVKDVCLCARVRACACVFVCVSACACVCLCVYACVRAHVCICACTCVCLCAFVCACVHVCACVCVCVSSTLRHAGHIFTTIQDTMLFSAEPHRLLNYYHINIFLQNILEGQLAVSPTPCCCIPLCVMSCRVWVRWTLQPVWTRDR